MEISKTLYVATRSAWRAWLKAHHATEKEIWLVYYRKSSGKPRISYSDALDEALCFGWIDGIVKRIDDSKFCQRFTPRRKGSPISEANKERVRRLIKSRRMTKKGLVAIDHKHDEEFKIPTEIITALKKNPVAWKHFQAFPDWYKKVRTAYIGRRLQDKEGFKRRMDYFIKKTEKNEKFGMVR